MHGHSNSSPKPENNTRKVLRIARGRGRSKKETKVRTGPEGGLKVAGPSSLRAGKQRRALLCALRHSETHKRTPKPNPNVNARKKNPLRISVATKVQSKPGNKKSREREGWGTQALRSKGGGETRTPMRTHLQGKTGKPHSGAERG